MPSTTPSRSATGIATLDPDQVVEVVPGRRERWVGKPLLLVVASRASCNLTGANLSWIDGLRKSEWPVPQETPMASLCQRRPGYPGAILPVAACADGLAVQYLSGSGKRHRKHRRGQRMHGFGAREGKGAGGGIRAASSLWLGPSFKSFAWQDVAATARRRGQRVPPAPIAPRARRPRPSSSARV